jgi:hypothetical protein
MSEMRERVLRAIIDVIAEKIPDNRAAIAATIAAPYMLRAIHAAMRDPTVEMALAVTGRSPIRASDENAAIAEGAELWRAALDEALE